MIHGIGTWWLDHWLPLSLYSALWLIIAYGADRALRSSAPAAMRLLLYVLPLAPLLAALGVSIPIQLPQSSPVVQTFAALTVVTSTPAETLVNATVSPTLLGGLYVFGSVSLLLLWARAHWALQHALRQTTPCDHHPDVRRHSHLGPCVIGLVQPTIILPAHLPEQHEDHILAHERAHIHRQDPLLLAVSQVLFVLAWPVLPLWLALSRIRQLIEVATDQHATATYSNTQRRQYGRTLVQSVATHTPPASLAFGWSSSPLEERVGALIRSRPTRLGSRCAGAMIVGLGLTACTAFTGLTPVQVHTTSPAPEDASLRLEQPGEDGSLEASVGTLERTQIDTVIRRNLNPIRYCYQRELAADPTLSGQVTIRFTIRSNGSVDTAETLSTTMNNATVEQCIAEQFRRMEFPKPDGDGPVTVDYPFDFSS